MTFPVHFHLFGADVPAHAVCEMAAYFIGFQLYLLIRRKARLASPLGRAGVPFEQNAWIIVGCVFGAVIGSKLLAWIESPIDYWSAKSNPAVWIGGKTIAGGLMGGWIGVEIAKKRLGIRHSTGDLFVFPLIIGIAIGRVGCFLTGLPDHTFGLHTSLPWAVNFGDGPRHPTQLYEIAFLLLLGVALFIRSRKPYANGELFRLFLASYLLWRVAIEFIKPRYTYAIIHLSAIQISSALVALYCLLNLRRLRRREPVAPDGAPDASYAPQGAAT